MNLEDIQALLEVQNKAGAIVKPLSEAPADIQRMAEEDTAACMGFKPRRRSPTAIWRVVGGGEFRYEDGEYACSIKDVRLDIFLAFTGQLQAYADAVMKDDAERAFTSLARAYALLQHRSRWWERWIKVYFISAAKARNRLILDFPARAIYTFLPLALAEYHAWITGGKKKPVEAESPATPDTPKPSFSSPTKPASESEGC